MPVLVCPLDNGQPGGCVALAPGLSPFLASRGLGLEAAEPVVGSQTRPLPCLSLPPRLLRPSLVRGPRDLPGRGVLGSSGPRRVPRASPGLGELAGIGDQASLPRPSWGDTAVFSVLCDGIRLVPEPGQEAGVYGLGRAAAGLALCVFEMSSCPGSLLARLMRQEPGGTPGPARSAQKPRHGPPSRALTCCLLALLCLDASGTADPILVTQYRYLSEPSAAWSPVTVPTEGGGPLCTCPGALSPPLCPLQ